MKLVPLLFCLFLIILESFGQVIHLTQTNFTSVVQNETIILANFHTQWCGYCQQLNPILLNVAKDLSSNKLPVKIAFVDVSDDSMNELIEKENIDGFPTLILYKEGMKFGEYTGQRTESEILEYLKQKASPLMQSLTSQNELIPYLTFLENNDLFETGFLSLTLGFFLPADNDDNDISKITERPSFQLFKRAALKYELSSFFYTTSKELIRDYGIEEDCMLVFTGDKNDVFHRVLFQPNKGNTSLLSERDLLDQLLLASLPLSVPFTLDTHALINSIPVHHHALAFYDASGSDDTFLDMLMLLAPKFKGRIMIVEVSSDEYPILHYFNIRQSDLPQLVMIDMSDEQHVKRFHFVDYLHKRYEQSSELPASLSQETKNSYFDQRSSVMKRVTKEETEEQLYAYNITLLEDFFQSYLSKQLQRSLLSEDVSVAKSLNEQLAIQHQYHKNSPLPLENIVSTQINEKLFTESIDKDVFLYFHAPWCIHCKATEPFITELALLYKNDENFQIYRIDGSKNEISLQYRPTSLRENEDERTGAIEIPMKITGFPSFYLFSRYNKTNPVEYLGDRNIELFHEFIQQKRLSARNLYYANYSARMQQQESLTQSEDQAEGEERSDDGQYEGILENEGLVIRDPVENEAGMEELNVASFQDQDNSEEVALLDDSLSENSVRDEV